VAQLLDSILSHLDEGTVRQMAGQLGIDPATAQSAIPTVLSTLLGGMARNAADPQGAADLHAAVARDHDGSLLDNLSGLLGGDPVGSSGGGGGLAGLLGGDPAGNSGGGGGLLAQGAGILGHVFGGRQGGVATQVGQATGLDTGTAGRLLMMLAPIVMSYLGRMHRQQGLDPGGLAGILGGAHAEIQQSSLGGILGSILDADHDGSVLDDLGGLLGGLLGGKR
jgi:hypothetical protein